MGNPYHAKKRFGQNFLVASDVIDKIVQAIKPSPEQTIIEIGPGRGALTLPLAKSGATIIGVEFDRDIISYVSELLSVYPRVHIINHDFLTFQPDIAAHSRFTVVGNIPYNITSPVIDWLFRYRHQIVNVVLMVQDELARRIAASPGSKDWSPLSIMTQLYFEVTYLFSVPPSSFSPAPKVTSAVIRLSPRKTPIDVPKGFERVVRASFHQRRKLLSNNLSGTILPNAELSQQTIAAVGLTKKIRAEQISIEQFLALTNYLIDHKLLARD
ncbi:MAG: 16S rRNA (adenine(1518)-N(6)/adenine(1519)-N(6))-dimethyltransferase RsmA [candidate division Zixibacteria bacterium]|nr:16S rRNA (adenine(1518)-N(6)/adenine(1519)-N(6))-dimethyltransferase RsmA [candidate division Zixibacteria bacterium]